MRLICCLLFAGLLATYGAAAQSDSDFIIRAYQVPVEHQVVIEAVLGEAVSDVASLRTLSMEGSGQRLVQQPTDNPVITLYWIEDEDG